MDRTRWKSAHHGATLPVGHVPLERPYQRISVELGEYKIKAVAPNASTSYRLLATLCDSRSSTWSQKSSETIARVIIKRDIGVFGPLGTLHSDWGFEFKNENHLPTAVDWTELQYLHHNLSSTR